MARESITALMAKKGDILEVRQDGKTTLFHVFGAALIGTKVCMEVLNESGETTFISLGASDHVVRQ